MKSIISSVSRKDLHGFCAPSPFKGSGKTVKKLALITARFHSHINEGCLYTENIQAACYSGFYFFLSI